MTEDMLRVEVLRLWRELADMRDVQDELKRVNQQLAVIVDQQPVIPYICRAEGDFGATFISPRIRNVTGWTPEHLTGDSSFWVNHIHPDDRERVFANIGEVFEHGHHEHEYRWQVADGTYRWFYDCFHLFRDADGKPDYFIGVWLDITERRLVDRELRAQKALLQTIVDSIPDAVSFQDADNCFALVNQAFCSRMGVAKADIIGRAADSLPEEQRRIFHDGSVHVRQTGEPETISQRYSDEEEEAATADIVLVPVENPESGVCGVIGVGRDVTRRERELAAAKERAEQASSAKTEFLANMSHEIRTPLNSILGYSQILGKTAQGGKFSARSLEYLEHINTSGYNLLAIVNNVLELSKIEEGKASISEEPVALATLVKRCYNVFKLQATEKKVRLSYFIDEDLPASVLTDQTKLTQIINNLLSNAIKFTPANKRVDLRAERHGERVQFTVSDQGIGIAEEQQVAIFTAFEQADGSITRAYGGTGLGLTISRRLSQLLGGDIRVESELGQGATFIVELPLKSNGVADEHVEVRVPDSGVRFAADSRILLVEDNPMNQEVMRSLFEQVGLTIDVASDGRSGVARAIEIMPECVFMDLHMPGMDGVAATRQLRELSELKNVPIVILSADAFSEQKDSALAAGATDYMTKPVVLERLIARLETYLRPAAPTQEKGASHRSIIDRESLASYPAGLLSKLTGMLKEQVPPSMKRIRAAVSGQSEGDLYREAHSLKNSGMGVHARHFVHLCTELEIEARKCGWGRAHELTDELDRAFPALVDALNALLAERG